MMIGIPITQGLLSTISETGIELMTVTIMAIFQVRHDQKEK
jgi:hypothetical protein